MQDDVFKNAAHTPAHLFRADAIYMITGSIYQRRDLMCSSARKSQWKDSFLRASALYGWDILAWVVLTNHYHVLVQSPKHSATNMSKYIGSLHKYTARRWNDEDHTAGRRVWWNYWDTCVRSEQELINKLRYILWNPVKHGLVEAAGDYAFSNYKDCLRRWKSASLLQNSDEVSDVSEF
jgi:putative transposase